MATHFAVSALKLNTKAFKYASDALVNDANLASTVLKLKTAMEEITKFSNFCKVTEKHRESIEV